MAQTLFDKLWSQHRIADAGDGADLIAIDRLLLHERTGGVALKSLKESGRPVFAPERSFAIMDHIVSFRAGRGRNESRAPGGEAFITETRKLALEAGLTLIDTDDPRQGIVHVVAPEQGLALPGLSIVCPDSHTCSLGALGALAWGIGSSEAEHVLTTGVIRVAKPKQKRIRVTGRLRKGVTAKDLALHIIAKYGAAGGERAAIEYCGEAIEAMDIEARLTLCNLSVEFAAFTAVIAPDEKTIDFISSAPYAPTADLEAAALLSWRELRTDDDAKFDDEIEISANDVDAMITWGNSPEDAVSIGAAVPDTDKISALKYMGLKPGDRLGGIAIDGVFIGSCTNGRLSDLRAAASVLAGRRVAQGVRAVCVPGSQSVRAAAEREGIDAIFKAAGFEWGEPGCAMCFYAGGETFPPRARVVSSTNRNFEGRQGPGVRTHLASPATAAASAVAGRIVSVRDVELTDTTV